MPLRRPTATRDISQLGLAQGGSLAQGYNNYKVQMTPPVGEQATAEQTAESVARYANLPDEAQVRALNAISQVTTRDKITDEEARRIAGGHNRMPGGPGHRFVPLPAAGNQPETRNLPAVVKQELITDAGQIIPQWHVVRNLPAYILEPIRVIGRQALNAFTRTEIENIVINSTLSNAEEEVRALARYIAENGVYVRQPDKELMTFAGMFNLPDAQEYLANVRLFQLGEQDFLLVRDNFGVYIYSWETKDRVLDRDYHIEAPAPRGLLR